jgi:F-type H+-transporting ATPase subunit epsilon
MALKYSITTPERLIAEGDASLVVVPAIDGELGILTGHAPLMALLGTGELRISAAGGARRSVYIDGGFIEVIGNRVNVLATEAELAERVDSQQAGAELEKLRSEATTGLSIADREKRQRLVRAAKIRAKITGRGK